MAVVTTKTGLIQALIAAIIPDNRSLQEILTSHNSQTTKTFSKIKITIPTAIAIAITTITTTVIITIVIMETIITQIPILRTITSQIIFITTIILHNNTTISNSKEEIIIIPIKIAIISLMIITLMGNAIIHIIILMKILNILNIKTNSKIIICPLITDNIEAREILMNQTKVISEETFREGHMDKMNKEI